MIRSPSSFPVTINRTEDFGKDGFYKGTSTFSELDWRRMDAYLCSTCRLVHEPYIAERLLHKSPFKAQLIEGELEIRECYTTDFKSAMISFRPFLFKRDLAHFYDVHELVFRGTDGTPIMSQQAESIKLGFELEHHKRFSIPRALSFLEMKQEGPVLSKFLKEGQDALSFGFLPGIDTSLLDLMLYGRIYHTNEDKFHQFAELEKTYGIDHLAAACHRFLASRYNAIIALNNMVHVIWVNATKNGIIDSGWFKELPKR